MIYEFILLSVKFVSCSSINCNIMLNSPHLDSFFFLKDDGYFTALNDDLCLNQCFRGTISVDQSSWLNPLSWFPVPSRFFLPGFQLSE